MDEVAKVKIPAGVFNGLEAVRISGRTNMFDRPVVAAIAMELGFVETAFWLTDKANHKAFAEGIFRGFQACDDQSRNEEPTTTP